MSFDPNSPVGKVRDPGALQTEAETEVGGEIQSETDPLSTLRGTYETQERRALEDLTGIFKNLMPFISMGGGMPDNVGLAAGESAANPAQLAQAAAQQSGSPVPFSFMKNLSPVAQQESAAWIQRVFPLIALREQRGIHNTYGDKIRETEAEIANIQKQKGTRVSKRFNELLTSEREFWMGGLSQQRDWQNSKESIALEKERLRLAREELYGGTTKKPTLSARQFEADRALADKSFQLELKRFGLSTKEFRELVRSNKAADRQRAAELIATHKENEANRKQDQQRINLEAERLGMEKDQFKQQMTTARQEARFAMQDRAIKMIDALSTGGSGETIEYTRSERIQRPPVPGPNDYMDPAGNWYRLIPNFKERVGAGRKLGPKEIFSSLVASGVPATMARNQITARYGKGWNAKPKKKKVDKTVQGKVASVVGRTG